jgi:hypothetical protein
VGAQQLRLIEISRAFLLAEKQRGVDVAVAPECYLNGWAHVVGKARLSRLASKSTGQFKLMLARVKEAIAVARQSGYEVVSGDGPAEGFTRLAVSWCRSSDFAPDGSYTDRYFRISSRANPTTLWFLIAIDHAVPERLDANIAIFRRKPQTPRWDFLYLVRSMVGLLARKRRTDHGRLPLLSATVSLADHVTEAVAAKLESGSFRSVVLPYEAQPFQHAIFRAAKAQSPDICTVGYLHSALPPLPTDLIYRAGAPELLLVHGRGQVDILARDLGWPREALRCIAAFRYRANDAGALDGFIFLPYAFFDPELIENAFRDFLAGSPPGSLPPLTVRNHPWMRDSKPHARLTVSLETLMATYRDRFANVKLESKLSVFIGATAAILEALERGVEAVHICSQPVMESHNGAIWRELNVERLGEYLFRYRLPVRDTYIEFGADDHSIDACLAQSETSRSR